jgi:hypothetical protein
MRAQKKSGRSLDDIAGDAAYDLAAKLGLPPEIRNLARELGEKLPSKTLSTILDRANIDPRLKEILDKVGDGLLQMKREEGP